MLEMSFPWNCERTHSVVLLYWTVWKKIELLLFVVEVERGLGVNFLLNQWILSWHSLQPKQRSPTYAQPFPMSPCWSHGNRWSGSWVTSYVFPSFLLLPPILPGKNEVEIRVWLESEEVGTEWWWGWELFFRECTETAFLCDLKSL